MFNLLPGPIDTKRTSAQSGFTMIELMVVVVIIGIIAAFAYPAYLDQIRKSRRSDAMVAINDVANQMEKYYARCLDYNVALTVADTGCNTGLGMTTASRRGYYALTLTPGASSYTITATQQPPPPPPYFDPKCVTFTLSSTGVKSSAPDGNCW